MWKLGRQKWEICVVFSRMGWEFYAQEVLYRIAKFVWQKGIFRLKEIILLKEIENVYILNNFYILLLIIAEFCVKRTANFDT